jgi:hypothetical protein
VSVDTRMHICELMVTVGDKLLLELPSGDENGCRSLLVTSFASSFCHSQARQGSIPAACAYEALTANSEIEIEKERP